MIIEKNMKIYSFLIMITIGFLFPYGAQGNTPRVTGVSSSAYRVVERIPVEPIWSGTSVGYCLLTHENHQFIAYYDANRQMTVAQRSLDSKDWTFKKMDSHIRWDSHNYITMALDKEGYLHVSGNMHAVPLVYFRASTPYDVTSLEQFPSMVGSYEDRVTYPKFLKNKNNDLIFTYRNGGSGNGNNYYNIYDTATKKWQRLLAQPFTDGEGAMNAYNVGPVKGPDGWFHMSWIWRDTPAAETNHDLSYAKSPDLINWFTAEGAPISLPIKLSTPGVIVDPVPIKCGMINGNGQIGFDSQNRVILSYHKFEDCSNSNSPTQFYNARLENGKWKFYQTTNWDYRWYFEGTGSLRSELRIGQIFYSEGKLKQGYTYPGKGSATFVLSEKNLKPIEIVPSTPWPAEIQTVRSTFPNMRVQITGDAGSSKKGEQYIMRYETLPSNRDKAYPEPWPAPEILEVYKLAYEQGESPDGGSLTSESIKAETHQAPPPGKLTVNMLSNTGQVLLNGYPANTPLERAVTYPENWQFTEITTSKPVFGWVIHSKSNNTKQQAYRILVASDRSLLIEGSADLWDTGQVNSDQSVNVPYNGKPLEAGSVYFWKVKTWDNHGGESPYSNVSAFKTADRFVEYGTDRYPIQKTDEYPIAISRLDEGSYLADFGKASFGRLRLNLYSETGTDSVIIHLGETTKEGCVDRSPGGTIRYSRFVITPQQGVNSYVITIPPDKRNTGPQAVLMPKHIGEVTPFRYCEIENYTYPLRAKDVVRESAFYPFNEYDSHFHSSDTVLNQIWELSKYSIKATSFLGVYVDGDRERIPYEADALINQLAHYGVANDFSMARYTHEYLICKPTWPTEWILQSVLMAWADYMYTGNTLSMTHFYEDLQAKSLIALADENGFISTRTGKVTPEVLASIHFNGNLRDIVDWPHTGILGLEKEEGGETDGFVFTDINTVVNAFHYKGLTLMSHIAGVLGKMDDQAFYRERAEKLKKSFNTQLFDRKRGVYIDGVGTDHASLHANMFPLAFGMVPENRVDGVLQFIRSRGMACSVYGSQFLLDGIYNANDAEYGLQLLTSTGERSWYNMIRLGSTITLEAWDNKYKPNLDWNHAWGAAPANLIPRKLMGIEPILPGFEKIRIKPQPGTLASAEIKQPTIRGDILVSFINHPNELFRLDIDIPANTTAEVHLPFFHRKQTILMDGQPIPHKRAGNFSVIENVGSGSHSFVLER